ncbi:hypothetical protein GFJ94_08940 [Flavobacterium sp. LMO8]|uniref:hypothetical protein n=1 Tax=Flavobacterium sp. LMO8 TaxID=2654244 RepID=UPI0012923772|nr:hypothetical protein [Flavobacterium sp. LMO8]MQP25189.1 hypothetical protein [Flavobacterium sp. LMO8]
MKKIIFLLLLIIIGLISFGYFQKNNGLNGDKWIGIGVLLIAFALMPLFIYHRYKNKNVKDYLMSNFTQEKENTDNQ